MTRDLDALMNATRGGPAGLEQWLDQNAARISPALGAELHAYSTKAIGAQQIGVAGAAALASAMVYLRSGRKYESLDNYLNWHQMRFMAADDLDGYSSVREGAQTVVERAHEIGASILVARGTILAADSAFFAAEVATETDKETWLRNVLADLAGLASTRPGDLDDNWVLRLASLVAALVDRVDSLVTSGHADVDVNLRKVAAATERLVPSNFVFPGDYSKTTKAAQALASLSYRFGNRAVARARLDFAQDLAERS